jgi:hypothetical protein
MAPLYAQVDTYLIQLLGRWRSDIMLAFRRYAPLSARPSTTGNVQFFSPHGSNRPFSLIPGRDVPKSANPQVGPI